MIRLMGKTAKNLSSRLNKGLKLSKLGRNSDAIVVWAELIEHYRATRERRLAKSAAFAATSKARVLWRLGRLDEAIAAYDDLLNLFREVPESGVSEAVAQGLLDKGELLSTLERGTEALKVFDELIERFESADEPMLSGLAGVAFHFKLRALGALDRPRKERVALARDIVNRFENAPLAILQNVVDAAQDYLELYNAEVIDLDEKRRAVATNKIRALSLTARYIGVAPPGEDEKVGRVPDEKFFSEKDGLESLRRFLAVYAGNDVLDDSTLAEAALVAARKKIAGRPIWDDRKRHKNLRHLNAARFVRSVYGDLIDGSPNLPDGRSIWHLLLPGGHPVWQEAVRSNDPKTVQMLHVYIRGRGDDLGDAEGLIFEKKVQRPVGKRPKTTKRPALG